MTHRALRRLAGVSALLLLLGACGGGYHPPEEATGAPEGQPSTPAAEVPGDGTADSAVSNDPAAATEGASPTGTGSSGGPGSAVSGGAASATAKPGVPAADGRAAAGPAPGATASRPGGDASPGAAPAPGGRSGSGGVAPAPTPAPVPGPGGPAGSGPIKVGGVFPLSGPIGTFGRAMMHSMKTVYAQANEAGGIGGRRIDMIVYDDQFDPAQGKRHTQALISQGIFAFAAWTPGTYEAVKEDLRKANVPGLPMDVGVERQRTDPLSFPPYAGCLRAQAGAVQSMLAKKVKKVAFLELDIEAVHRCMSYVEKIANAHGIEVVYRGNVAPGGPDCGPLVLAARSRNPDLLLPFEVPLGTIKCLQAVRQQGWKVPIEVGLPAAGDQDMIAALGDYVEGVTAVTPFAVPGFPAWEANCGAVRKYFPETKLSIYSTIGCVGAIVLVKGAQAVGPSVTKESLMRYLESGAPISTGGVTPDLVYRPGDHRPFDQVAPIEIKGGKWVQTGPYYTPARLSEDIKDGD